MLERDGEDLSATAGRSYLQVMDEVRAAMAEHPGYRLLLVGHSMGAGTAAILTMMCATCLHNELQPHLSEAVIAPCLPPSKA